MAPEWKTIKISASAYEDAVELREAIARAGLDALPDHLRERALDDAAGAGRGVGIGAVVALGLRALADVVSAKPKRSRRRRS